MVECRLTLLKRYGIYIVMDDDIKYSKRYKTMICKDDIKMRLYTQTLQGVIGTMLMKQWLNVD